jgi:hypothetical protein
MNTAIYKIGYRAGLFAFAATAAYVTVQLLQVAGVFSFPLDEILIYGTSLCIVIPFILEMLALYYVSANDKKFWTHAAVIFTSLYAAFVTANYVVQLTTVIPATLKGTDNSIQVLKQTPHSLFWDFDAIGYIFMALATLFAIPVFKKQGYQKWVRYSLIAHTLVTPLIVFVYFYPIFSNKLLMIGFPWAITAPLFMLLLAIFFKKELDTGSQAEKIKKTD